MNEFNVADIAVVVFLIFCAYFYYNKGLILTLFGFCTTLISAVLAGVLSPLLGNILRHTSIFDTIKDYVAETILKTGHGTGEGLIKSLSIPEFLQNNLITGMNGKLNTADYVSEYIAGFIINIISMITVFLLLFIIFKVLANVLNLISHLPVLKTANKLGGGIFGLLEGVLIIWILFAILTMLYGKPMFSGINETIADSMIASKFYDSNILIKGLSGINNLL